MKVHMLRRSTMAAAAALLLAACGGGQTPPQAASDTAASTIASAAPSPSAAAAASAAASSTASVAPTAAITIESPAPSVAGSAEAELASAPPADLAEGWQLFDKPEDGFAIALPPTWTQIDVDQATLDETLSELRGSNPELADVVSGQMSAILANDLIKFWGFDVSPEGAGVNLNLIRQDIPIAVTLDDYMEVNVQQIEALPYIKAPVAQEATTLGGQEGSRLQYDQTLQFGDQSVTQTVTQYITVTDDAAYVLTFTALPQQIPAGEPVFEQIAQSFSLAE